MFADASWNSTNSLASFVLHPLSNFIETAVLRYLEREEYVDEFEMEEIRTNRGLNASLKRGVADAKTRRGRFA